MSKATEFHKKFPPVHRKLITLKGGEIYQIEEYLELFEMWLDELESPPTEAKPLLKIDISDKEIESIVNKQLAEIADIVLPAGWKGIAKINRIEGMKTLRNLINAFGQGDPIDKVIDRLIK